MDAAVVLDLTYRALWLTLMLVSPVIVVSLVVGLGVAFLEAITQIQDQSIGTSVKIIAIMLTMIFTAHWIGSSTMEFARSLFDLVATLRANARG